jgi:hypothetical protein
VRRNNPDMASLLAQQIFEGVDRRAFSLSFSLRLLEQLYIGRSSADRAKLQRTLRTMERTASAFFSVVFHVLVENVFLNLSVLTDPPRSNAKGGPRENLSIPRLLEEVTRLVQSDPSKRAAESKCRRAYERLEEAVASIRLHRHRRIAHGDAAALVDPSQRPGDVTVRQMRKAVRLLFAVLREVERVLRPGHMTGYDNPILPGCGEALISVLEAGLRLNELEMFLLENGAQRKSGEELRRQVLDRFFVGPRIKRAVRRGPRASRTASARRRAPSGRSSARAGG